MIRLAPFLALLFALVLAGCGRPGQGQLTTYVIGSPELVDAHEDPATHVWESAPWAADGIAWIPFRPHEQVQLEHGLGRAPTAVLTYLSFTMDGATPSLAAGDLSRVVQADETFVTVWNDTNGTYFVRVVIE